jgi:hypothetical protein
MSPTIAANPPFVDRATVQRVHGSHICHVFTHTTCMYCEHILPLPPTLPTRPAAPQTVDLLFLRAICHHALGLVREAVRDYTACLTWTPPRGGGSAGSSLPATDAQGVPWPARPNALSEEQRGWQYLSFYQREVCGLRG